MTAPNKGVALLAFVPRPVNRILPSLVPTPLSERGVGTRLTSVSLVPEAPPRFYHGSEIKSGSGLGTRLNLRNVTEVYNLS